MAKYKIIDNALPVEAFKILQNIMLSSDFPWFYSRNVNSQKDDFVSDAHYWYKFSHLFYNRGTSRSNYFGDISPLLNVIDPMAIIVSRGFLLPYTGNKVNFGYHKDIYSTNDPGLYEQIKVAVFYLNTNNGGTMFKSGEFVESVENRLLLFNVKEEHASVTADNTSARILINTIYF